MRRNVEWRARLRDPEAALRAALAAGAEDGGTLRLPDRERRLLLDGSTRIHLDAVTGLGAFAEIEVVVAPGGDVDEAHATAEHWRTMLGVAAGDVLAVSYAELAVSAGGRTARPADAR